MPFTHSHRINPSRSKELLISHKFIPLDREKEDQSLIFVRNKKYKRNRAAGDGVITRGTVDTHRQCVYIFVSVG